MSLIQCIFLGLIIGILIILGFIDLIIIIRKPSEYTDQPPD